MDANADRRALLGGAGAALVAAGTASAQPPLPAAARELAYKTVGELRAMLDAREVSALELTDAAISRIGALDGAINAVCVRDFERARHAARAADAALARSERAPLAGIPTTVKEAFNVAGLPTTWGLLAGRDWRPEEDAVAVARLKAAGAVILGKTNVATALADWQSDNPVYGRTSNPFDLARTPGGSSGGSAAALAAGFTPLELGSDIGGSIRVPAHLTGVYGHKPSAGIVPLRGLTPPGVPASSLDITSGLAVAGPMARSAADLALALAILAGPDEEATAYRLALPAARHEALGSYRVLILDTHPLGPTSGEVRGALDTLAARLAAAGVRVARMSPLVPDLTASAQLHLRMMSNVEAFGRPPAVLAELRQLADGLAPGDLSLAAQRVRGALMSRHDWIRDEAQRLRLRAQWGALFREFDVVLCPPFSVTAFPHDRTAEVEQRRIEIDGAGHAYISLFGWITLATPPGLPATVAPIARTNAGLPIGVQIIGPYLEDLTPIAFAGLIEREFGGFQPPAGYR